MKNGDKIIWDSGFGYEIGHYISPKGVTYGTHLIDLKTGKYTGGLMSVPMYEIEPYNLVNVKKFTKKYGYEKSFSTQF